jgi:hypothetical protein
LCEERRGSTALIDLDQALIAIPASLMSHVSGGPMGRSVARCLEPGRSATAPLKTFRQIRSGEDVIHLAVRLGLLAFLVYWSFILVQPFVPILAWSAVLA